MLFVFKKEKNREEREVGMIEAGMTDVEIGSDMDQEKLTHEFGALNTLLLVVVLGLCVMCAYIISKNKFHYLPESAAATLVGFVVGGMARIFYPTKDELDFLSFNPEMFFFLLLPPIIFHAGYNVEKQQFFDNIGTISLFAVFGTIVSTFVVGWLCYAAAYNGLINVSYDDPLESLMFGALISAVDPVATLSIMGSKDLNCDRLLYSLVFGESVLNDAVSIVLFHTLLHQHTLHEEFTAKTLFSALLNFSLVTIGSLFVGIVIGLSCCFLFKHSNIRQYPKFEISLLFLFAYGSYAFSESIELSGIMAIFFNGVILSHYNLHNLSRTSYTTVSSTLDSFSTISEFFVFSYMGMGVFTGRFTQFDFFFGGLAILFCCLGRILNIVPFSFLANLVRRRKISGRMQFVMCFAGLRGAIAFAMSQSMPGDSKDVYASATLMIVLFTTLVCGGLTAPILMTMDVHEKKASACTTTTTQRVYNNMVMFVLVSN